MREFGVIGGASPDGPFTAPDKLIASWSVGEGLPREVAEAFEISGRSELEGLRPQAAFLDVPAGDPAAGFAPVPLVVVAEGATGPLVICVWAETGEGFGPMARTWLAEDPEGREDTFVELMGMLAIDQRQLGLDLAIDIARMMVQTLLVARETGAASAVLIVHDFAPESGWFDEYELIGQTMDTDPPRDRVVSMGGRAGVALYAGWVTAAVPAPE